MAILMAISVERAQQLLDYLRYAYPVVLLVLFLVFTAAHSITKAGGKSSFSVQTGPGGKPLPCNIDRPTTSKDDHYFTPLQKGLFTWLSVGVIVTFLANAVNVVTHAVVMREEGWWCGQAMAIYVVASFFVYTLFLISLIDAHPSPTVVHFCTWMVGLGLELVLLATSAALYKSAHRGPSVRPPADGTVRTGPTGWDIAEIVIDVLRVMLLIVINGLYAVLVVLRRSKSPETNENGGNAEETSGLLAGNRPTNGNAHGIAASYGTATAHPPTGGAQAPRDGWSRPTTAPSKGWWEYLRGYSIFFPYLWPSKDKKLQAYVFICFILVLLQRGVNVLVPYQTGRVTDILSGEDGPQQSTPWGAICLLIGLKFLQGNSGIIGALRSIFWIPVGQYSYQALSTSAFEHVHSLSLDFHLGKKTGEVLSALSKGNSINTFLEQVTFQVLPMLVDLCVAFAYFLIAFDAYYALVVAIVTFWYLYLTIRLAQWRAEMRRQMVNASREEDAVKNDSMVSYETVKYFNAEQYEFQRYRSAVQKFQRAEYQVFFSLNVMNVVQNMVFTLGFLINCFIAAYQVTSGQCKVGRFVTLLIYMAQLQQPLNFFGTFYRTIQSALINSERMLELFKERPTVVDEPDARPLPSCEGEIRFDSVNFSYDSRKPALTGLTFRCAPGTTTALVGESGGGKSTVFRLLFRFYNAQEGSIQVDGHDVKTITIDSLRRHMGVVPQDTVLFNESLMYNLKYANPSCTDEQVYEACRAACIHDKILTFPDGYQTRVGERGLRLSGGEKQRVAIARTILKGPRIILLDEATAALDTETEQHIQSALSSLSQGRTMLVIAHRLSTISTADQILVLHEGRVAEAGTHEELLAKKGKYASMWKKQIRAQKAAEEAQALKDRADRLRLETTAGNDSGSQSEDDGPPSRGALPASSTALLDETAHAHSNELPPGHP